MLVAGVDGCRAGWIAFTVELPSLVTSLESRRINRSRYPQTGQGKDAEGVQGTRNPDSSEAREEPKGMEGESESNCNLLFPASGCNPKLNFLDNPKAVAERAQLDPKNFWLHKFRATFATRCLGAGV
jgi:hypothetical protein